MVSKSQTSFTFNATVIAAIFVFGSLAFVAYAQGYGNGQVTSGDTTVTLLENPPCFIDCYAVYEICNAKPNDMVLAKNNLNFKFKSDKDSTLKEHINGLQSYELYLLQNVTKTSHDAIYGDIPTDYTCTETNFTYTKTHAVCTTINGTVIFEHDYDKINIPHQKITYNVSGITGYVEKQYIIEEFTPFSPTGKIFKKNECNTIKIVGHKLPNANIDHVLFYDTKDYTEFAWWNASFLKKKAIQINNTGEVISNYSIPINVTYDSDMQSNFADLRFTNSSENEELSYWIENNVSSLYAVVWVKIPYVLSNTTNTSIYVYYENDTQIQSKSDIKTAFLRCSDDFNDNSLDSMWTIGSGSAVESSGILTLSSTNNNIFCDTSNSYPIQRIRKEKTVLLSGWGLYVDNKNGDDGTASGTWGTAWSYASLNGGPGSWSGSSPSINTWFELSDNITITSIKTIISIGATGSKTFLTPLTSTHKIQLNGFGTETNDYDYVIVRKLLSATPTYSFGAEEVNGDTTAPTVTWNYPTANSWNSSKTFNVGFTPADETALANCTLRDNRSGSMTDTVLNTSTLISGSVNTIAETFTTDGHYNVSIKCSDTSGNTAETAGRLIKVDSTKPSVTITLPEATTYLSENRTLNFTATDTNIDTIWYSYNGTNTTITDDITFTALDEQTSTITVYANDSAGNINLDSVTFTIDSTQELIWTVGSKNIEINDPSCINKTVTATYQYEGDGYLSGSLSRLIITFIVPIGLIAVVGMAAWWGA